MGRIKPLPEAVHSSVRSGIILFDMTRVVEELVFNSLDAGATKVSVAVGVGTFYVKVVDNGSGITRDGLVLLGERYATSKLDQLADMDTATGSFGFRGEALGSISDVSLLEIVTKAHGRPNGYRKVMKGCKCLFLGIDDDRHDVGTTVIVRDLFYNQPVRRKHLQSSPKKVLHSVKKCVLRIALVHLKVSFKVVDIESEDELLCTYSSSSPLPLLMSGFGTEFSSSHHELDVSDSVLKLSGYISGPCETFSVKAFQYFYINSRFICKGPVHKLLNQVAANFSCQDLWKANIGSHNGKRSRSQTYPTYILNLSCPRSHYDLTFEPSKTSVEFKDWGPILTFIEEVITHFWSQNISYGDSLSHGADMSGKDEMWKEGDNMVSAEEDFPTNYGFAKKRCRTQCHQDFLGLPSPQLKILTEESKHMSACRGSIFSCQKSCRSALEFEELQNEMEFPCETDYSFQVCDGSLAECRATVSQENGGHLGTLDSNVSSPEDYFVENKFATERSSGHEDFILGSRWEDVSPKVDANMSNEYTVSGLSADCFEIGNDAEEVSEDLKKPFLQSCTSQRSLLPDGAFFTSDEGFIDGFRTKKKWLDHDDRVDIGIVDYSNQKIEPWQDNASTVWSCPSFTNQHDMQTSSDFLSRHSVKSFSIAGECFAEDLPLDSVAQIRKFGARHWSFNSEWSPLTPDPLFRTKVPDVELFIDADVLQRRFKYDRGARYDYFADREGKDCIFSLDTMRNSSGQENCSLSSYINVSSGLKGYDSSKGNFCAYRGNKLDDVLHSKCYDSFSDETEWLCLDSCGKDNANVCATPSHHISSMAYVDEDKNRRVQNRYRERSYCGEEKARSHSAPPFYRGKKKFFALNNCSPLDLGKSHFETIHDALTLKDNLSSKLSSVNNSLHYARPAKKRTPDMTEIENCETQDQCLHIYKVDLIEDFTSKETQDSSDSGLKWRNSCPQTASGEKLHHLHCQDTVLDVSSGILHLAGDSLVPESINKNYLEDAKVLPQVDKKFIPVVAGGTLAVIDQHAADERIRLEDLRQKVLTGETKTITYLDAEHELVLPEIGYQLLHNYAEQIQNWGWICNIHAQSSKSFKRNLNLLHRQPSVATLLAVPCILGVNLTDADLIEFLQQLAETDGSSAIPPSVLRVLNSKACRGAIMFGDTLLPSECSLIVEELKQTSLCFQCAHGRPTTAPLVNLEVLHKQIAKLGLCSSGSNELWHGLCRHEFSVDRAAQRLSSTGGQC